MLKDAIAGATPELDAIAGPILRAAPDSAPVTCTVVADILSDSSTTAAAHRV